ncbi:MAG: hypothetical protein ACREJO_10260 [Phycisphaerales bacterium]
MDPWLHSLSESLTLRHLASPFIELECRLDDSLQDVLRRARALLSETVASERQPLLTRAAIRIRGGADQDHVLVLDQCLRFEDWAEVYADDEEPVSTYARPVSLESLTDGATGFVKGLLHLQLQENFGMRSGGQGLDTAPPEEEGEAEVFFPRHFLVILERGRWQGVVTPSHFQEAIPVRVAMLSTLLELEESILDYCRCAPEGGLKYLSPGRIVKALATARSKEPKPTEPWPTDEDAVEWALKFRFREMKLLSSTNFVDKMTIARDAGVVLGDVPESNRKSICNKVERLRNWCCHTNSEDDQNVYSLDELADVFKHACRMLDELTT